jgi:hypothetical protein
MAMLPPKGFVTVRGHWPTLQCQSAEMILEISVSGSPLRHPYWPARSGVQTTVPPSFGSTPRLASFDRGRRFEDPAGILAALYCTIPPIASILVDPSPRNYIEAKGTGS